MKKYMLLLCGSLLITAAQAQTKSTAVPQKTSTTGGDRLNPSVGKASSAPDESTQPAMHSADVQLKKNIVPANSGMTIGGGNISQSKTQIPDGTYGSNKSGTVYSPSNPNFPYAPNGELYNSVKPSTVNKGTN